MAPTTLAGLELIHQVVHASNSIKHRANIAIKLYLSKVFDCVEWDYLITLMQKLNFPDHLIQLIHHSSTLIKFPFDIINTKLLILCPLMVCATASFIPSSFSVMYLRSF